jgi:hypothetical protein
MKHFVLLGLTTGPDSAYSVILPDPNPKRVTYTRLQQQDSRENQIQSAECSGKDDDKGTWGSATLAVLDPRANTADVEAENGQ